MKVKDLITKLQQMDPEADIVVPNANYELLGHLVAASEVCLVGGRKAIRTFRDDFERQEYQAEIIEYDSEKPAQFVKIG